MNEMWTLNPNPNPNPSRRPAVAPGPNLTPTPSQDIYMNEMRLDEPDLILDIILQVRASYP